MVNFLIELLHHSQRSPRQDGHCLDRPNVSVLESCLPYGDLKKLNGERQGTLMPVSVGSRGLSEFGDVTESHDREGLGKPSQKLKRVNFFSNLSHKCHKNYIDFFIPLMNRTFGDCQ